MPYNFTWLVPHRLAGSGRPGSALELAGEMLPHEQRFLAWLNSTSRATKSRDELARLIGMRAGGEGLDARMEGLYRKFRDFWHVLEGVRDEFGAEGEPVDRFARDPRRLDADLAFLAAEGVVSLMSLTETPIDASALEAHALTALHLPVLDKEAPTIEQVEVALRYLDAELAEGRPVVVHCLGGYGRTGTILAAYLVHCGATAEEAIAEVRRARPGSIETSVQEQAVWETERRIR